MTDREKVIRGWERCRKCHDVPMMFSESYRDCEYTRGMYCRQDILIDDTLALLKEQEAVQPLYTTTSHPFCVGILYHCGNCHHSLCRDEDLFCRHCGKLIDWEKGAVKWE